MGFIIAESKLEPPKKNDDPPDVDVQSPPKAS